MQQNLAMGAGSVQYQLQYSTTSARKPHERVADFFRNQKRNSQLNRRSNAPDNRQQTNKDRSATKRTKTASSVANQ